MKIKPAIFITLFFVTLSACLTAQDAAIPIQKKGGHLLSQWMLNDSIRANVFLESGFPKIIFSKRFIEQHPQGLNVALEVPVEDIYVSFWSAAKKYKAQYTINDTITINGSKLHIDAVVVDTDSIAQWRGRDILFPIADLQKRIELNIGSGYMRMLNDDEELSGGYIPFDVAQDGFTKALYLTTTLTVYDSNGGSDKVSGNFQLDLGAGNAIMLNKNQPHVAEFFRDADRMAIKDTTQLKGPKNMDVSVLTPHKVQLANIQLSNELVVGLKYAGKHSSLYTGNIGPSFFQGFIVVFDFQKNKVYLKPAAAKVSIVD